MFRITICCIIGMGLTRAYVWHGLSSMASLGSNIGNDSIEVNFNATVSSCLTSECEGGVCSLPPANAATLGAFATPGITADTIVSADNIAEPLPTAVGVEVGRYRYYRI